MYILRSSLCLTKKKVRKSSKIQTGTLFQDVRVSTKVLHVSENSRVFRGYFCVNVNYLYNNIFFYYLNVYMQAKLVKLLKFSSQTNHFLCGAKERLKHESYSPGLQCAINKGYTILIPNDSGSLSAVEICFPIVNMWVYFLWRTPSCFPMCFGFNVFIMIHVVLTFRQSEDTVL
jgi:hypothetical protein